MHKQLYERDQELLLRLQDTLMMESIPDSYAPLTLPDYNFQNGGSFPEIQSDSVNPLLD